MQITRCFFSCILFIFFLDYSLSTFAAEKSLLRKFFPRPLYQLKLKAKEIRLRRKPSFRYFLKNIKENPLSLDIDDFIALTDEEFLYAHRYALTLRTQTGEIILSNRLANKIIDECVRRFEFKDNGYAYNNFDQVGIKEIAKYYQIINPEFDKIETKFIFTKQDRLPESVLTDQGKVLYILDLDLTEGCIHHVTMMFINHETKQIFVFDSLGMLETEIESYKAFFGKSYSIYYNASRLQHDSYNCMIFAILAANQLLSYGEDFFKRLETTNSSESPIPETIIMLQSISKMNIYDNWFRFIKEHLEDENLKKLQEEFLKEFIRHDNYEHERRRTEDFCKQWLPILHRDRTYLEFVSENKQKLLGFVGGIRGKKSGQKQNFYLDRLRLKYLYFMAQKK